MSKEPETEEERRAAAEAIGSLDCGRGVPMEVVLAELGLTVDDFRWTTQPNSPEK